MMLSIDNQSLLFGALGSAVSTYFMKTEGIPGRSLEGVQALDTHVERILFRSQSMKKREHPELSERYRYVCSDVPMDYLTDAGREYSISLRVIRVEISPGSFENLITNLPGNEFDMDDFKELYHLRWDQENAYRDTKIYTVVTVR